MAQAQPYMNYMRRNMGGQIMPPIVYRQVGGGELLDEDAAFQTGVNRPVSDIYAARERANEWDYAAGHAVAQKAGAIIKTLDEKPFLYGKEDYRNPSLLIKRAENLND